ncbi:lysozyme inhibitor LprI family protein [Novosphingobium sp. P6W]|uniref:lysozyme inhibitor LprI family protein n=1 Tax=Novosphingobium sp. P6W TaxID=1609758 RepID=UPI000A959323|nr:lysozyme inhibitor LprI family protein [Novosphingobium sp. P6W]
MIRPCVIILLAISTAATASPASEDRTEAVLQRCLDAPAAASTAGQTECEVAAARDYDRRMNAAYNQLLQRLGPPEAARLRSAQRAWLAFRTADEAARAALYETRQGTMYVPMQAAASAAVIRDRALQLETSLRVMMIDE